PHAKETVPSLPPPRRDKVVEGAVGKRKGPAANHAAGPLVTRCRGQDLNLCRELSPGGQWPSGADRPIPADSRPGEKRPAQIARPHSSFRTFPLIRGWRTASRGARSA